jgi:hypothetical protein
MREPLIIAGVHSLGYLPQIYRAVVLEQVCEIGIQDVICDAFHSLMACLYL